MGYRAKNPSTGMRVGLVLFDESHSRVFALRDTIIENAREFTVDVDKLKSGRGPSRVQRRLVGSTQIHERAAHTARLAVELHDEQPFDYLLVAGPPWARALVWQHLPLPMRERLVGSLNIAVAAGESAILGAVIPSIQMIARRAQAEQRRAVLTASQKSRSGPAKQPLAAVGGSGLRAMQPTGH